jgi:inorganic triphosphatase YgiF
MTTGETRADSGSASEVEVEVKLAVVDPEAIRDLIETVDPSRLAGFEAAGPVRQSRIVDRYIDTAGATLAGIGARARVRTGDGPARLALKRRGIADGAVTSRREVEGPATEALEPAGWPASAARSELLELARGEPLLEIARLRQRRTARDVVRGGTRVELSLDALDALDGDEIVASRWELEAELKAGDVAPLHELAVALQRNPATGPPTGSKLGFAVASVAVARARS